MRSSSRVVVGRRTTGAFAPSHDQSQSQPKAKTSTHQFDPRQVHAVRKQATESEQTKASQNKSGRLSQRPGTKLMCWWRGRAGGGRALACLAGSRLPRQTMGRTEQKCDLLDKIWLAHVMPMPAWAKGFKAAAALASYLRHLIGQDGATAGALVVVFSSSSQASGSRRIPRTPD